MSGVLSMLARERQRLTANVPRQPSEAVMQAAANARERAALPSLLPPAPTKDVAAWNDWAAAYKKQHPNGPAFAPPEYIAYANAKLEPASGSTYRFEVQYNYDPASGALLAVENAQTGFIYWQVATSPGPDAFGQLQAYTDGNNVSTVMAYDAATGVPVGISSGAGGCNPEQAGSCAVQDLEYSWDGYGNLEERQDYNQSLTETFKYDDLNRLTGSTVTNPANNGPTLGFNYDAAGNIQKRTLSGVIQTYTYDPNHPYAVNGVSDGTSQIYSASYDADGNMLSRNGYALTWTPANLPESIASSSGSSTFSYDPDHARYYQAATFNGVTTDTTYVGGLFEVISTSTGTTEYRHNIVADGEVIAVHTIDGNGAASTNYLHYDHLGSMDAITDDQGSVIQAMSFDVFGLRRDATNWDYDLSQNTLATLKNYTDRGFTFQEELDNLSLVDMNGRVYDPTVGRFISADPMVPAPFYSQAFNRYSSVYDNPLIYRDPSGYDPGTVGGFPGPQEGQNLYEMQQQPNSIQTLEYEEHEDARYMTGTVGSGLVLAGVATALFPGTQEAAPELINSGIATISATDAVVAALNSVATTYSLTQGADDLLASAFDSNPANLPDLLLGQSTGNLLTAGVSAWDWANILAEPKSAQAAINILTEGLQFLTKPKAPANTAPASPNPGVPGSGPGNNNNGNNGGGLIQLPVGCGCDGSYTGPNETSPSNTINIGTIQVTGLPPTTVTPPPPPPPPQPVKCMDGSGKLTTCPT